MLLGVDVGGTFTDAVLVDGRGALHTAKVPSTPAAESDGVLRAVELVLDRAGAAPEQVQRFAHGMTVATNALLEGNTARTALIATAGFTDVIELARQDRPHLYRLCEAAPAPLVAAELRFAARERMAPEGVLEPLEDRARARALRAAAGSDPEAVAVCAAALLRRPRARAALGEPIARAAAGTRRCRSRASWWAPSASTSARRRPSSTPRSPRCWPPTWRRSARGLARRACPSRRSCSPRAG